ncbi:MAG TPA: SLC13 family permease, partial [Acidobacteriota bacterium]|nr:SLC13 family permease [Acidobacteriota bacterium]
MTTVPFTFEIGLMLALIGATLVLFVLERFPIEVTAMSLLAVLVLTGFLEIDQAIAGLSNKAVITVGALLVLSHALVKTGLLEIAADHLSEKAANHKWLGIGIFLAVAAGLSGFLNNTAVVAIFIPLAISL